MCVSTDTPIRNPDTKRVTELIMTVIDPRKTVSVAGDIRYSTSTPGVQWTSANYFMHRSLHYNGVIAHVFTGVLL